MNTGQINVSVANLYRQPHYSSEVVSQALLGEPFTVLCGEKNFTSIKLDDGYEGWVSNYQWVNHAGKEGPVKQVRSHILQIREKPDHFSRPVRDAVIGNLLHVKNIQVGWVEVSLPDGNTGYVPETGFGVFPDSTRDGVRQLALEFLGYPYHWGGRSPKGFDCSGFVQTVFSLIKIKLPRDSWMQHRDGIPVSKDPGQAALGDLFFFAENPGKISHVGMALGNGKIIHVRGMVRINSLRKEDAEYMSDLVETFVEVRTYFA
jgi:cell wall-associated NlpC family hydrolase